MQKVKIPEGEKGNWKVERFTISKKGAALSVFSLGVRASAPGK